MRQDIFFLICVLLMISCKNGTKIDEEGYMSVKIENGSGDDFSYISGDTTIFFAPYPFSTGHLKDNQQSNEVMIISRSLDAGDIVAIKPLARLELESVKSGKETVILAIPVDDGLSIISAQGFDDFVVSHFGLKQIVEFWYSNRYGLQGTRVVGWSPASSEDIKDS